MFDAGRYMSHMLIENVRTRGNTVLSLSSYQAMVVTFSLGIGAIPWIIMSEVISLGSNLILLELA